MKLCFLLLIILIQSSLAFSQEPKYILQQSFAQCQSIEKGYYEMTRRMKYMTKTDTSSSESHCHFKKLPDDTITIMPFITKIY